jgi:hypothetical protein
MKKIHIMILFMALTLSVIAATACESGGGTTPATSQPSSSLGSPASTPAPDSTTTTAPTSASTSPPTAGSLPLEMARAVFKTKDVLAVRFQVTSNVTFTQGGQGVTLQGINVQGEGNGPDQHLTFSGPNPATGKVDSFELIKLGGQSYMRGFSFGQNLDPNAWYQLPGKIGNSPNSAPNPQGILSGMNQDDFLSGDFKLTGVEVVDLLQCQVWAAHNPALARKFSNITNNPDAQRQLTVVDTFEVKLWTCADGYMHQMKGAVTGHDPKATSDKAKLEFAYRFYDFGANMSITAPANAQPIPFIGPSSTATP